MFQAMFLKLVLSLSVKAIDHIGRTWWPEQHTLLLKTVTNNSEVKLQRA